MALISGILHTGKVVTYFDSYGNKFHAKIVHATKEPTGEKPWGEEKFIVENSEGIKISISADCVLGHQDFDNRFLRLARTRKEKNNSLDTGWI